MAGQQGKRVGLLFILGAQGRLLIRCHLIKGFKEERARRFGHGRSTLTERKVMYKS